MLPSKTAGSIIAGREAGQVSKGRQRWRNGVLKRLPGSGVEGLRRVEQSRLRKHAMLGVVEADVGRGPERLILAVTQIPGRCRGGRDLGRHGEVTGWFALETGENTCVGPERWEMYNSARFLARWTSFLVSLWV